MITHMNKREIERTTLEKKVTRLLRAIQNGGVPEDLHEQQKQEEEQRSQQDGSQRQQEA